MMKRNKKWWYFFVFAFFIIYIFAAARPVPKETVIVPRWITSVEMNYPVRLEGFSGENEEPRLLPFILGNRFGYVGDDGRFAITQTRNAYFSMSEKHWAEFEAYPSYVRVMNPQNETVFVIEDIDGFPLFLDGRVYIMGSEQNSITALGPAGEKLWTHVFPAKITDFDAAAGFVLAGTLDGAVVLLNPSGNLVFPPFEPGGSRLLAIYGCAISRDASRIAIISGIDSQRFLLLERSGDTHRVIHHEFLGEGFRRRVHVSFVNNDRKVVFEREGGLGIFDISSRRTVNINLEGEIVALDNYGGGDFLFVITSHGPGQKRLITIRYPEGNFRTLGPRRRAPGIIVNEAPFSSDAAFFARRGNRLFLGGDSTMISFEMEKR